MKKFLLLFTLFASSLAGLSQNIAPFIADSSSTNQWGGKCYMAVYLPVGYKTTNKKYPIIFFTHGKGQTGTGLSGLNNLVTDGLPQRIRSGFVPEAINPATGVRDTFIVVAPQHASWSMSYAELKYIVPYILNKYRVDSSCINMTGLSAGGTAIFSTLGSLDSSFTALFTGMVTANGAGPVASNGYTDAQVVNNISQGMKFGTKLWVIASELDQFLNVNLDYHKRANTNGRNSKFTVIAGVGHSVWGLAYNPVFRPIINFYGNTGNCNSGCAFGGIPVAPNSNGSSVRGSGVTQDSLNLFEWMLLQTRKKTEPVVIPPPVVLPPAPTADAGKDDTIYFPNTAITLKGRATGDSISYRWQLLSFNWPSSNTDSLNLDLLTTSVTYRLTVTDKYKRIATDDKTIYFIKRPYDELGRIDLGSLGWLFILNNLETGIQIPDQLNLIIKNQ